MKTLIIAAILVAVCYAQPPPPVPVRPVIPDTFESEVEVMFYEKETIKGHGFFARDEASNEGVELVHAEAEGKNESRIRLERFDKSEVFLIRGSGENEHCETRKVNSTTLPPYWEWVKEAKYNGQKEVQEKTLDVWMYDKGPGVQFSVLVDAENVNVPRYLYAELGSEKREVNFLNFKAVTPRPSLFEIPEVCQQ